MVNSIVDEKWEKQFRKLNSYKHIPNNWNQNKKNMVSTILDISLWRQQYREQIITDSKPTR